MPEQMVAALPPRTLVRHEGCTPRERSTCGWRDRLISREDVALNPAAWAHAVDIDGAKLHYHRRATELYYVLDGAGVVLLNRVEHQVRQGSLVHIPPGVVHGWSDIPDHVDYLSFRPSQSVMQPGWVNPTIAK